MDAKGRCRRERDLLRLRAERRSFLWFVAYLVTCFVPPLLFGGVLLFIHIRS